MPVGDAVEHGGDRRRRAEEEGARDAVDDGVGIARLAWPEGFATSVPAVGAIVGRQRHVGLDGDRLGHAVDEQHRAEQEADDDAFGEVAEDDQHEGDEQHQRVAARGADQRPEGVLLHHVPGDIGEHAGECGERDVAGERRGDQHEDEQEERVQHARHRPMRAGPHIGRGAGDGAGGADAAEQRGADVGEALRDQLAVGAVAPPGHAVGHHRRQQRFDRAEQREGDGVRQHRGNASPG